MLNQGENEASNPRETSYLQPKPAKLMTQEKSKNQIQTDKNG